MTVSELIAKLTDLDPDAEVQIDRTPNLNGGWDSLTEVEALPGVVLLKDTGW